MPQDIIERQFESSFLKRIRYSGEGQLLIVEFKTGEIYQYSAVPDWRVHELLGASSIGSYFSTHIAKTYSFVRLPKFPCNDTLSSGQTTPVSRRWCHAAVRGAAVACAASGACGSASIAAARASYAR